MLTDIVADTWKLPEFTENVEAACLEGEHELVLKRLWFGQSQHDGFLDQHAPVAVDAKGRHHLRAGSPSRFVIHWEIEGIEYLETADLQIYDKDSKLLTLVPVSTAQGNYESAVVPGRERAHKKTFTCADGPYLVRLRIVKVKPSTKVPCKARRLYFDVAPLVVVGGGIAGIRTAEILLAERPDEDVVLLEARTYLGGRARTEEWEGVPIDLGCQFLQDADDNPLVMLAADHGRATFWHRQVERFRADWITASAKELKQAALYAQAGTHHETHSYRDSVRENIVQVLTNDLSNKQEDDNRNTVLTALDQAKAVLLGNPEFQAECHAEYPQVLHDLLISENAALGTLKTKYAIQEAQLETASQKVRDLPPVPEGEQESDAAKAARVEEKKLILLLGVTRKSLEQKPVSIAAIENQLAGMADETSAYIDARTNWMEGKAKKRIDAGAPALKEKLNMEFKQRIALQAKLGADTLVDDLLVQMFIAKTAELDEGASSSLFTLYEPGKERKSAESAENDEPEEKNEAEEKNQQSDEGESSAESESSDDEGASEAATRGTSNRLAKQGYGALIAHHALKLEKANPQQLIVHKDCMVSEVAMIDTDTPLVRVTTSKGVLYGCGMVLTVPTATIGKITFTPELPAPIKGAFADLPMGHYKKTFLPLKDGCELGKKLAALVTGGAPLADGETDLSVFTIERNGRPWWFLYRVSLNMIVAFLGGEFARLADVLGDDTLADEALSALSGALGLPAVDVKADWTGKLKTSTWSSDPLSCGAYTYTKPCVGTQARKDLREGVVAKRLVFAGEAVRESKEQFATAHGAWLSGEDAARRLIQEIGI